MGLNSENAERVVFDIETAPLLGATDYLEPAEAPSNYKDPAKIAEYIAAKHAESLDRCALDVDLCRVVAIGAQLESGPSRVWCAAGEDEERIAIEEFWSCAGHLHLVGFNCLAFDLPVLLRRSQYLGLAVPGIAIDRFRHPQVTDLQMVLSFNGAIKLRGLGFYCRRFGIDVHDELTGADIGAAVEDDRWDDVAAHCAADIQKTSLLAAKLGLFRMRELAASSF